VWGGRGVMDLFVQNSVDYILSCTPVIRYDTMHHISLYLDQAGILAYDYTRSWVISAGIKLILLH